ncbi:hypothetical protein BDF14DRAFT_1786120 [Spinellus fusiger]|nr:hypothetical protein BDF14DRAFT_1786120 [Spinellus fusiger]
MCILLVGCLSGHLSVCLFVCLVVRLLSWSFVCPCGWLVGSLAVRSSAFLIVRLSLWLVGSLAVRSSALLVVRLSLWLVGWLVVWSLSGHKTVRLAVFFTCLTVNVHVYGFNCCVNMRLSNL